VTEAVGVLLAAGAGTRMGRPKALVTDPDGTPWLHVGVHALLDGGCDRVVVVLGAAAERARALLPRRDGVTVVVAEDWAAGPGASLVAGLAAVTGSATACVSLVDLPGLPATAVRRVLGDGGRPTTLRRAVFGDRPGHPVLVGSAHRASLVDAVAADPGDRRAGAWLRRAGVAPVDCTDLWDGTDRDRPTASGLSTDGRRGAS
jgi:molybdenum cofactor cytidylyltransferase